MIEYPKDECYTPLWLFEKLEINFDLDVASSNHPLVVVPSAKRFTKDDDGLSQKWIGNIWMNPPFSKVTPWIDKWLEHGNGICLVPLSSNGRWVNKLWDSNSAVCYLPPNMAFQGMSGHLVKMRWRTALFALGENNVIALQNVGTVKVTRPSALQKNSL